MMRLKILFTTLCLAAALAGLTLSGCGREQDAASAAVESLPFSVPETFSYSEEDTARNNMLTFSGGEQTTLIINCTETDEAFLESARSQSITAAALTAAYKQSGLDVSIESLDKTETADKLLYTYIVHLPSLNGDTVTYKYIRITGTMALDISCGGSAENGEAVKGDYDAVVEAIEAAEAADTGTASSEGSSADAGSEDDSQSTDT